ncbi:pentachlorophenol monooxygenase [Streptomyces piniterrae]|uniref:Pentachlorophenol monooxygenase n=1 Tax=Streptomyces piniterrae TaxID=2571125 RepID=A0A4U0MSZ4_9ACTN|nr:FAD-dependent monooxygenase [Streptomyces piniterrae]TJZ44065.1 pentachlorophenol monooxygenase [Streptomyces piniterrae]
MTAEIPLDGTGATEVLIVGAGPTGLTLACDLARRGVRAHLIEKSDHLFPGSRGKGLQPRTQEVFDDLGVIDEIRAGGAPFPPMQTWEGGERRGEWDLIDKAPGRTLSAYPRVWMIPQWRTQRILYERLLELGGSVEFETTLLNLEQTDDHVTVELAHPDGTSRTVTARYLVGADGGHSTVRHALGLRMTAADTRLRPSLVADVRIHGLDRDNWHVWPKAPGGPMLLCPLPGTEDFQFSAQFDIDRPHATHDVRTIIGSRSHLPASAVTHVRCASYYQPHAALAPRFKQGRVFLAGDAAHVHPPGGGQGLNTSVQDAYNLGWKLGQVLRHGADRRLLESYAAERLPVAAAVLKLSTRLYRVGRTPEVGSAHQAAHRGRMTNQLDVGYRESPLSREARRGTNLSALCAGDRAPDLPWPAGQECRANDGTPARRLFDLLRGPQFTLLAVAMDLPDAPRGVHAHQVDDSTVASVYGEGLFLVRPDGYVGLATHDPADVPAYLATVGLS